MVRTISLHRRRFGGLGAPAVVGTCAVSLSIAVAVGLGDPGGAEAKSTTTAAPKSKTVQRTDTVRAGNTNGVSAKCPKGFTMSAHTSVTVEGIPIGDAAGVTVTSFNFNGERVVPRYFNGRADEISIKTKVHCISRIVNGQLAGSGVQAKFSKRNVAKATIGLPPGGSGQADAECRPNRVAFAHQLSPLGLDMPPNEFVSKMGINRSPQFGVTANNPTATAQSFEFWANCVRRKATVIRGASAAQRGDPVPAAARQITRAKARVSNKSKTHTLKPHSSLAQSQALSGKCPKRHTVASFGWNARDTAGGMVLLRPGPSFKNRTVKVKATNLSGSSHKVKLTAICLAMKLIA